MGLLRICLIPALLPFMCFSDIRAQDKYSDFYSVQAAYILNFIKFIDWPEKTQDEDYSFKICFSCSDGPVSSKMITKGPKKVLDYNIDIKESLSGDCRIIFICKKDSPKRIIGDIGDKPILTVGESADFIKNGGMINFYLGKSDIDGPSLVMLEINDEVMRSRGMLPRSALLDLSIVRVVGK